MLKEVFNKNEHVLSFIFEKVIVHLQGYQARAAGIVNVHSSGTGTKIKTHL